MFLNVTMPASAYQRFTDDDDDAKGSPKNISSPSTVAKPHQPSPNASPTESASDPPKEKAGVKILMSYEKVEVGELEESSNNNVIELPQDSLDEFSR